MRPHQRHSRILRLLAGLGALALSLLLPGAGGASAAGADALGDGEHATCGIQHEWARRLGISESAMHRRVAPAAFDPADGRDPSHRPADRRADILHIKFLYDFPELSRKRVSVTEWMLIAPLEGAAFPGELAFDAERLVIRSVSEAAAPAHLTPPAELPAQADRAALPPADWAPEAGRPISFYHNGHSVRLAIPEELRTRAAGQPIALRFEYEIENPPDGMFWIEPLKGDPDPRWEVWTQGEADATRWWTISHDYPNERHTSEMVVRTSESEQALAAGVLIGDKSIGPGRRERHWRMEQPHVTYLLTLVVGTFHVTKEKVGGVDIEVYAPPARSADVSRTFARTKEMLQFLSERFGVPYPYPRYAQVIVREFGAGGMENITQTTLTESVLATANTEQHAWACMRRPEGLIVHELAHQWFGDLVTCRSWPHLWLNEGWASFSEELWAEKVCGRDEYRYKLWRRREHLAKADPPDSNQPLVFTQVPKADEMFGFNGAAAYNKGAWVLHMLRTELGEDVFWRATREYLTAFKHSTAATEDFRGELERVAGRDLEAWFRQWAYRAGTPRFDIALNWDAGRSVAVVTLEQGQSISPAAPAFQGTVDLVIEDAKLQVHRHAMRIDGRRSEAQLELSAPPARIWVDPQGAWLASQNLTVGVDVLAATALGDAPPGTPAGDGSATFSHFEAVRALGKSRDGRAREALVKLLGDKTKFWGLRDQAARALGAIATPEATRALCDAAPAEPDFRVRAGIAEALRSCEDESAAFEALLLLAKDPADAVATVAVDSLGYVHKRDPKRADDAIHAAFLRRGDNDQLAGAALTAWSRSGSRTGIADAMLAMTPGWHYRLRPRAAGVLGDLIDNRLETADAETTALIDATADLRASVRLSAVRTLGRVKARRAIPTLERLAARTSDAELSKAAADALTTIRDAKGSRDDVQELERKLGDLRRELRETKDSIDKLEKQQIKPAREPESESGGWFFGLF